MNSMKEGGEIIQCITGKDHLATTSKCLTTMMTSKTLKNSKHQERLLACGFNGFGQFQLENKRKLQHFEELKTFINEVTHKTSVASAWSYLAIANNCSLRLQGFIGNTSKTVKIIKTEYPIKSLAACDKYCLILLENGKLYKLLPDSSDHELKEITFQTSLQPSLTPQKRGIFGDSKSLKSSLEIDYVACGDNITAAVSRCNLVFSGTIQIHQFPKHVRLKQLQCGFEHAVLLTWNGDIYTWGNGLRGQLGQSVLGVEEIPTLVEALAGIKITYIAAGGWHNAAISAFGDLYTWGFNSNGQMGLRLYKTENQILKEPTVYPLPQLIDLPPSCQCNSNINETNEYTSAACNPLKVIAGARHTMLLMQCGTLYATGWNTYGQLGIQNLQQYCDQFQYVLRLEEECHGKDIQIICGNWCTIINISNKK